jgi:phosphoadenosine phosphosulfate reductase
MRTPVGPDEIHHLVESFNSKEKVDRSLELIMEAYKEFGDGLVVANSLGKDSCAVWDLAKRVSPKIRGFVVTTRFKPAATKQFMNDLVARYPETLVFENDVEIPDELYKTDPDACCDMLKVQPVRWAIEQMGVACWITGLRCTEGRTRTDYLEIEERDEGLLKLNPILLWHEREVWQYLAVNQVPVNPLYAEGYRSLGCEPCTHITTGHNERDGRWIGTSKCGGECGIHTRPLKAEVGASA